MAAGRKRRRPPSRAPKAQPERESARESGDAFSAYLREIARFQLLTPDEEKALAVRIAEGDEQALNQLVEANLRFVVAYAKRYRGMGLSFIDLIHEGNLGLIEAARRFDPGRNVRFISYAVWWVRQAMLLALSEQGRGLRLPQKVVGQITRVQRARDSLTSALGREPTTAEVAGATDLTEQDVERVARLAAGEVSLSAGADQDGDLALLDTLEQEVVPAAEDELMRAEHEKLMRTLVGGLDKNERRVIALRYGLDDDEPRTLQEIGDLLGVTRERVRQIESRAKEKLRRSQQAQALRGCLN